MDTKTICFDQKTTKKKIEEKEKRRRIITETDKWQDYLKETDFYKESQLQLLSSLEGSSLEEEKKIHFLREQIRQKIYNYYSQDMKKQLYNPENFVTLEYILQKLKDCNLDCYYCREPVYIWYEIAREPKQWTVERIDNTIGHDMGNIEIACLSCNLKRRCMYHERYIFTKQMRIVKS
jgi:hypothetical protein